MEELFVRASGNAGRSVAARRIHSVRIRSARVDWSECRAAPIRSDRSHFAPDILLFSSPLFSVPISHSLICSASLCAALFCSGFTYSTAQDISQVESSRVKSKSRRAKQQHSIAGTVLRSTAQYLMNAADCHSKLLNILQD